MSNPQLPNEQNKPKVAADVSDITGEQPLIEHLVELRTRLLRALLGVLLCAGALLPFANKLYAWLAVPVLQMLPAGGQMIAADPISPFVTPLKLALIVGLVIAMPWVLFQIWGLSRPGCIGMSASWRCRFWCQQRCCFTSAARLPTIWYCQRFSNLPPP